MKQLTTANKVASKLAAAAVDTFIRDLNSTADLSEVTSHFRWFSRTHIAADAYGRLALVDLADGGDYGLTVWAHKGDTFVVPGFADETWTGRSTNGQFFTVGADEKPVIEEA
jgi:hypothetical protein